MMVNSGSTTNNIFYDAFQKIEIPRSQLLPTTNLLLDFTGCKPRVQGKIVLPMKIEDKDP